MAPSGLPEKKDRTASLGAASLLLTIPAILIAGPAIGFFLGRWGDKKLDVDPWLTVIGLVLGFVAAAREIHRLVRKAQAMEGKDNK